MFSVKRIKEVESLTNCYRKRFIISSLISANFFLFQYLQKYFCPLVYVRDANSKISVNVLHSEYPRSIHIIVYKLRYYSLSSFCSRINHAYTVQNQRSILCAECQEIKEINCICEVGKCRVSYCFVFRG